MGGSPSGAESRSAKKPEPEGRTSRLAESQAQRCDQENLIAQLAGGVRALAAPVDNLTRNSAYMLMASLAWTLKSWAALLLPVEPRWRAQHEAARCTLLTMEFKTFLHALVKIPCRIVKSSRRVIYRV